MSPQWTPPSADKQAWAPPAADRHEPDRAVRDHLQNEGFLDSVWNVVKSPVAIVQSLINGDYAKEGSDQYKRAQELQANGTPEQRREFAKEIILKNIPGASTIYKATHGNVAGAAGDVAGMAALGGIAKGAEKTADAAGAIKQVVTNPEVARAALEVIPKGPAIGRLIDKVKAVREAAQGAAPPPPEAITPGQILARESGADWAKLSPQDQAMLESVARARANVAAQPAARPPMGPPATPQADAPPAENLTLAQMIQREYGGNTPEVVAPEAGPMVGGHQVTPPVNGRGAPVRPPLAQAPQVAPTVEAVSPAVSAPPPPRTLPQVEAGMARTNPPAIDASESQTQYSSTGERKSPELIGAERTAANTAAKADRWAPVLHRFGITAEDLPNITPPQWEQVTAAMKQQGFLDAGENVPKSSIPEIAKRLKALETGTVQAKAAISPEPEAPAAPTGTPDLAAIPLDRLKTMKFSDLKALFPPGTPKADITAAIAQAMQKVAR